ncbi:MAG: hybrid sensor histidine kinase/response regulator [Microcoleaceae cyanobacterium]
MSVYSILQTKYILVVDDLPDNLFLIQLALEQEGHQVILIDNGFDALAQIDKSPPDLIILDVMMPGMSGYEVTQKIRSNRKLPFIPILLITAHEQSSVVKGLDLGADEFIQKPVQLDELQARVRSLLRLKHSIDQRENFVHCLTHDLRTPIVAANRMLDLLQDGAFGEVSPQMNKAFDSMITNNQTLLEMLNSLLDVYKYEVGEKNLSFIPLNIRELIQEVSSELVPIAQHKELEIKLNLPSETEINEVIGDRLELRRILTNLMGNAIKFTDRGFVKVDLMYNEHQNQDLAIIAVEDTGIGLSEQIKARIFEKFHQGNHKRSGSGLGLYLCKQIVEAHAGTIEVESELNKGSRFSVKLPVKGPK